MKSGAQTLEYHAATESRGMRLTLILAFFAAALCILDLPHAISQLVTLFRAWRSFPNLAVSGAVQNITIAGCALVFGVCAILLMACRRGATLFLVVFGIRFVLLRLALMLIPADHWRQFSRLRLAVVSANGVLHLLSMLAVTWLLYRIVRQPADAAEAEWPRLARDTALAVFFVGALRLLAWLVLCVLWYMEQGQWYSDIPETAAVEVAAPLLLAVSAGLLLLAQRWAVWFCVVSVMLWGVAPLAGDIALRLRVGQLLLTLRNMNTLYAYIALAHVPLAIFFTLLLLHPKMRRSVGAA